MHRSNSITPSQSANKVHSWSSWSRILILTLATINLLLIFPPAGEASFKRYTLDFNDRHFLGRRGEPHIVFLKRALHNQYPYLDTANLELRRVVLVAKSRVGRGHAQLRVGNQFSDRYRIDGHPSHFTSRHKRSFDRVHIGSPSWSSRGPWQMKLNGNLRVRKIHLEVRQKQPYRKFSQYPRNDWFWAPYRYRW